MPLQADPSRAAAARSPPATQGSTGSSRDAHAGSNRPTSRARRLDAPPPRPVEQALVSAGDAVARYRRPSPNSRGRDETRVAKVVMSGGCPAVAEVSDGRAGVVARSSASCRGRKQPVVGVEGPQRLVRVEPRSAAPHQKGRPGRRSSTSLPTAGPVVDGFGARYQYAAPLSDQYGGRRAPRRRSATADAIAGSMADKRSSKRAGRRPDAGRSVASPLGPARVAASPIPARRPRMICSWKW